MSNALAPMTREEMIEALMAKTGICWSAAAHAVDRHRSATGVPPDPAAARRELVRANISEKQEQAFVIKLFRGFGCTVYSLSQARASKQTPGLPDLWVVHRAAKLAFWFETKRSSGGKVSPAQLEFAHDCYATGIAHYIGDRRVAVDILVDAGLAIPGEGPCGIVRAEITITPIQEHA